MNSTSIRGIGLMCGTSRDALDMADVTFHFDSELTYELHATRSMELPEWLNARLEAAEQCSARSYILLDNEVGSWLGECVANFVRETSSKASYVASHGITTFHQPQEGITHQLGHGGALASTSRLTAVSDFRSQDVHLGGQGAPLVPWCDHLLFHQHTFTLNLGGFANVSDLRSELPLGFDIGPANLLLNKLASREGLAYDDNGNLARSGELIPSLLNALNSLEYYSTPAPKSLGTEWLGNQLFPIPEAFIKAASRDLLATAAEHIAMQIGAILSKEGTCLVTGGGALNGYLMERIKFHSITDIQVADRTLIEFKEAICFSLLGALRLKAMQNTAKEVTGARFSSSAGAVFLPPFHKD